MCPGIENVVMPGDNIRYNRTYKVTLGNGIEIDCIVGPGYPDVDFECNSLCMSSHGISSFVFGAHDIHKLMNIMDDIRNKIAREIEPVAKCRVKMWNKGWKIIGRDLAASRIQFQFRKAIACPEYQMCKDRLMREGEELANSF